MLKIYVVGSPGTGKTTISALIKKMLGSFGIEAKVTSALPGEYPAGFDPLDNVENRMASIKYQLEMYGAGIEVEELQAKRNGDFNVI